MNITQTKTIPDNWTSLYIFLDDQKNKIVTISLPVIGPQPLRFILWQGAAYDAANNLNNGAGYGNSDLISAITAYLQTL